MEKIPKFHPLKILSSRNFYKKFFGIMLVSLAFLAGCRQREVLPEPANDAIDSATLAKIQAWYNPKVARLRGAKSTGADIYLPQWGDGKLHTLPNGEKVALFPVHREKSVQYHNIGFVRRFAVRLSPTDSILSVKLLEMIGEKEYLRQHKEAIAQDYYLQGLIPSQVRLWQKEVPLSQNKSSSNPSTGYCYAEGGTVSFDQYTCAIMIENECGTSFGGWVQGCGGNGSGTGSGSGGSGGSAGGGSGGSNTPIYTDNPPNGGGGSTPPCPTCLSEDPGDNTNPPQEPERKITLNSEFQNNTKAMCVYERIKKMIEEGDSDANNNLFWRMTAPFSGANAPRLEIALVDSTVTGEYTGGLTVDSIATKNKVTIYINKQLMSGMSDVVYAFNILHELMHAYFIAMIHKVGETAFNNCILADVGCSSGLMPQKPYADFKDCYDKLKDKVNGFDELEHNVMATDKYGYRQDLIKAMKAFMGTDSPQISNDTYSAISWIGLGNTEVYNDTTVITKSQELAIKKLMKQAIQPSVLDKCN